MEIFIKKVHKEKKAVITKRNETVRLENNEIIIFEIVFGMVDEIVFGMVRRIPMKIPPIPVPITGHWNLELPEIRT